MVYSQICRLVKSNVLAFGCHTRVERLLKEDGLRLTLQNGWLAELAGLKRMKHSHMTTDFGRAWVRTRSSLWIPAGQDWEKITFGSLDQILFCKC
ncbi:hypothetical protein BGZ58_002243 [Dissophora ornata]|nr:hypothetical protein BGZ58_002243 [Dissophora ornata]